MKFLHTPFCDLTSFYQFFAGKPLWYHTCENFMPGTCTGRGQSIRFPRVFLGYTEHFDFELHSAGARYFQDRMYLWNSRVGGGKPRP